MTDRNRCISRSIRSAIGFPTMLLLPITTQCFPAISILLRFNSWIIPAGVQETNPFSQPQVHRHSAGENHRHLLRINCLDHMIFADMFREWKLAQNSMNIWIVIQFLNQCKQFLFRGFFRKFIRKRLYSNICTGFLLFLTYTLDAGSAPT